MTSSTGWAVAAIALLGSWGCGETVVTTSSGGGSATGGEGGGTGAATPAGGAGGSGGQEPVCSDACVECCNDPGCPVAEPSVGTGCQAPLDCSYLTESGCLQHWFCAEDEPDFWTYSIGPLEDGAYACPGSCPPDFTGVLDSLLCFDPGMTCDYHLTAGQQDYGCWTYSCQPDHRWSAGQKIGDTCP